MTISSDKTIDLKPEFFADKSIILAKSGYGKSYLGRVIVEEGLEKNHSFVIIDSQNAFLNMPEFDYIDIEKCNNAKHLGILLSQTNKNIVLSTKNISIEKQNDFLRDFLNGYKQHIKKGIQTIVIDEIHKYAPEYEKTSSKNVIRGLFQENRSDGLGIIVITQRVARVDKTLLSQSNNVAIGRVSGFRDKQSVKDLIDADEDLEQIKNLEKGTFYLSGFGMNAPIIAKIRTAKTNHSGDTPKNLLTENTQLYNSYIHKIVKKGGKPKMSDAISTNGEPIKDVIPSMAGFKDLVGMGLKMGLGSATSGLVGAFVGSRFKSPIPFVSTRTLSSGVTTIGLYAGYRFVNNAVAKDVLKYATAGSAVYTFGSVVFDVLIATNLASKIPMVAQNVFSMATGVSPVAVEGKQSDVDVNTAMA